MPALPRTAAVLAIAGVLTTGCTDQALVDRVAELEAADERLRSSLSELGAPDPEAEEARRSTRAEVDAAVERLDTLEEQVTTIQESVDTQGLEADDRLTALELQLDELRATITTLRGDLTTLTDRVSSLEAQFDAHRTDPAGHTD